MSSSEIVFHDLAAEKFKRVPDGAVGQALVTDGAGGYSYADVKVKGVESLASGTDAHTVTIPTQASTNYSLQVTLDNRNTTIALGANPLATVNTTTAVTVTTPKAHGLLVGQSVTLAGLTAFNGLITGDVTGAKTVVTVPTATTFTYTAGSTANATSAGGGSSGTWLPPSDNVVSLFWFRISAKTTTSFTIKLSDDMDSANYKANWSVSL